MSYSEPKDVYTAEELSGLVNRDGTIHSSVTIRGEYLREIRGVEKISGSLGSVDSKLESFGSLKEVGGDVWFSIHTVAPLIKELGQLETVGGDLRLNDLDIKSLGNLRRVGGNLNLRNVAIEDFGRLEYVGGNILLSKKLEGRLDLSGIEVAGKVKYFNDTKSRLDDIPKNQPALAESEIPVPLWKKTYAYSVAILDSADAEQKEFYHYFKQSFLDGKIVDVRGNSNYVFTLMFDLIRDFRKHRDEQLIVRQLTELETAYPVIQRYTEENLNAAIKGRPERESPGGTGVGISIDVGEVLDKLRSERPDLFEVQAEGGDEFELGDEEGADDFEADDFDEEFDEEEEGVERFKFPPDNPLYTVVLTETRGDDYNCRETSVAINEKTVAVLKARVNSIRADVQADRLFIQTMHSENEDSFSIFCFELSTGRRLWQTGDIPPGGSLYVDKARRRLEAGLTYGQAENYLVLLDYEGNILERNFRDGYEMIGAAEEHFKNNEFEQAKEQLLRALETEVSISTKIKAAKKLARIGKLTGNEALSAQFDKRTASLESEKGAEKTRRAERAARQALPLAERLSRRDPGHDEEDSASGRSGGEAGEGEYWGKRWRQIEEEGGS
jgi:hypothetical protein